MDEEPSAQNEEHPSQGISERGQRALKVIAVAAIVIGASSLAWMYPTIAAKTKPSSPPVPTPLPMSKAGDFVAYQFVDPSVGWAVGVAVYRQSNLGEYWVARTVDGAKHWQTQLRGQSSPNFGLPSSIQFFDKTHGFVSLGIPFELRRTVNGGLSWTAIPLPDMEGSFATFSDSRHGWLLAGTYPNQTKPARLYATSDAGDTWQRLPDPPRQSFRVAFRSLQEGWLRTTNQSNYLIYISRDAGRSWQRLDSPDPAGRTQDQAVIVVDVRLLPGSGAVASLALSDGRGFQFPVHEFTTFDMGRTWTYVPLQTQDSRSVRSDSFEDATHWWATLGASLYKSSDAGQTWKLVPTKLENGDNWRYSVQFLDSKHAWAQIFMGPTTGLAMTSDGGLHWTRASVPEQG